MTLSRATTGTSICECSLQHYPARGPSIRMPLSTALKQSTHELAFAVSPSFCSAIESAGFQYFPAGYDWLMSEREPLVSAVRKLLGQKPFSPLGDMYAAFLAPRMVPDLLAIMDSWRPDVVVRDPM